MDTQTVAPQIIVNTIEPPHAKKISESLAANVTEWFSNEKFNEQYAQGILSRISFAAYEEDVLVGLMTLEFPTKTNAHIYWLGISKNNLGKKIGTKLLYAAENYCLANGYSSLTAQTISPKEANENYLKIYTFLEESGFKALFEKPAADHQLMIYMLKMLSLKDYIFVDLTHTLSPEVPHWGVDVGFKYNARYIQSAESTGHVKFRVQRLEFSAGIGTHMDAPSHCFENAFSIDQLPLSSLITICRVINVSSKTHERYSISVQDILAFEHQYGTIPKNAFVILYTGWDKRWKQPETYRNEKIFPSISQAAAELLLARDIAGIGIDTLSPDTFGSDFPVHEIILKSGKYIIENVANADQLDPTGSFIFALPIKIKDGTEAPMRLIGLKRKI